MSSQSIPPKGSDPSLEPEERSGTQTPVTSWIDYAKTSLPSQETITDTLTSIMVIGAGAMLIGAGLESCGWKADDNGKWPENDPDPVLNGLSSFTIPLWMLGRRAGQYVGSVLDPAIGSAYSAAEAGMSQNCPELVERLQGGSDWLTRSVANGAAWYMGGAET